MTQDQKPPEAEEKEPIKVAISVPQIAGGALAAVTAALIGSQLGVAGTVIGAAVASVVGGVAGTLYSAGIDRTHRKVTAAISRGYEKVRGSDDYDRDAERDPAGEAEQMLPGLAGSTPASDQLGHSDPPTEPEEPSEGGRRRVWKVMGLTAAAMFVVALLAITFVELGLGRALDGREGTTVSQVVQPERTPSPTPSRTPSATPSATPTPTPTPSVTLTPSVTPAPTDTAPTDTGTPTATAVPSATVTVTVEPAPATTP